MTTGTIAGRSMPECSKCFLFVTDSRSTSIDKVLDHFIESVQHKIYRLESILSRAHLSSNRVYKMLYNSLKMSRGQSPLDFYSNICTVRSRNLRAIFNFFSKLSLLDKVYGVIWTFDYPLPLSMSKWFMDVPLHCFWPSWTFNIHSGLACDKRINLDFWNLTMMVELLSKVFFCLKGWRM